jgi:metal-responsive CopG/Arc/MetJ family transcriptional regulator
MQQGRVKKRECRLLNFWVPVQLLPQLDQAVRATDSDRSKFIRLAIRERVSRIIGQRSAA